MRDSSLLNKFKELQTRMRILILQNRSEIQEYDEEFLQQIHDISARLLRLKKQMLAESEKDFLLGLKKGISSGVH